LSTKLFDIIIFFNPRLKHKFYDWEKSISGVLNLYPGGMELGDPVAPGL
jgi:hypothetical protein